MAARAPKTLIEKFKINGEDDSKKARAIRMLVENVGKQVPIARLQEAIYGKGQGDIKNTKQVLTSIALAGTGTIMKREGRGEDSTHGLYARRA